MTRRPFIGQIAGWFVTFICLCLFAAPQAADAHRPDESYVFLIITDGPLEGEIHMRLSDMAKAVPIDSNGDGEISDEEVAQSYKDIATYLSERIRFFDDAGSHQPEMVGDIRFFGKGERRSFVLDFRVPSINPPPDALDVEFPFLYDRIDPEHRPMLLIKSNPRMRLRYNGSHVSHEWEPGADRQTISLVPPAVAEIVVTTLKQGALLILNSPGNLMIALAALLGSLRWYAQAAPEQAGMRGLALNVMLAALMLGIGFATGLLAREYVHFRLKDHDMKNIYAAALGLAMIANLLANRSALRAAALLGAGGLCGITYMGLGAVVGLNKGFMETVHPALALGVTAASCIVAVVILPLGFVLFREAPRMDKFIRIASIAVLVVVALFLFQRLVLT